MRWLVSFVCLSLSAGSSVHEPPGFTGASPGKCLLPFSPAVEWKLFEGLDLKALVFYIFSEPDT